MYPHFQPVLLSEVQAVANCAHLPTVASPFCYLSARDSRVTLPLCKSGRLPDYRADLHVIAPPLSPTSLAGERALFRRVLCTRSKMCAPISGLC